MKWWKKKKRKVKIMTIVKKFKSTMADNKYTDADAEEMFVMYAKFKAESQSADEDADDNPGEEEPAGDEEEDNTSDSEEEETQKKETIDEKISRLVDAKLTALKGGKPKKKVTKKKVKVKPKTNFNQVFGSI